MYVCVCGEKRYDRRDDEGLFFFPSFLFFMRLGIILGSVRIQGTRGSGGVGGGGGGWRDKKLIASCHQ